MLVGGLEYYYREFKVTDLQLLWMDDRFSLCVCGDDRFSLCVCGEYGDFGAFHNTDLFL